MSPMGALTMEWFEQNGNDYDREAETSEFHVASVVYHYFPGERKVASGRTLRDEIEATGRVGSAARCFSEGEIRDSLSTSEPHYGDGTYVTFHDELDKAHSEVKRHHGDTVSRRTYRAVLRVHLCRRFLRIRQTGGVGLATQETQPTLGEMLFIGRPEVEVIRLERLESGEWVPG